MHSSSQDNQNTTVYSSQNMFPSCSCSKFYDCRYQENIFDQDNYSIVSNDSFDKLNENFHINLINKVRIIILIYLDYA